jgi:hypothetical protein
VGVRILAGLLYAIDCVSLMMATYYAFVTRKVPHSVNEVSTIGPGEFVCYIQSFTFITNLHLHKPSLIMTFTTTAIDNSPVHSFESY